MNIKSKNLILVCAIIFTIFALYLAIGTSNKEGVKALINKPFPDFELQTFGNGMVKNRSDLLGEVSLVNVWATWCFICRLEHDDLIKIANENSVRMVGVNYVDDVEIAKDYLRSAGDPYDLVFIDDTGGLAFELGLYATPLTLVVDKEGIVRMSHVGLVNEKVWREDLAPIIERLSL